MDARSVRRSLGLALILAVGLVTVEGPPAWAAGTAAGTVVSNSASVDYQVGGIDQDAVSSNTATFKVDRKVDLTVATSESAAVSVYPGSSGNVLTFTVTNDGNDTFDFALATTAVATSAAAKFGGEDDDIDAASVAVYVDVNANGTYESGTDTATSIDDLAADGSKTVFVVASFNTGLTNGQVASYHLLVTAKGSDGSALTEDTDGDDTATVENVFADGQGTDTANDASRDAKHSDQADYKVSNAVLSVTKSSTVISDPLNGTTSPLAIPGAVIEYTLTISNAAGAATATSVTVSDSLNTEITNGTVSFTSGTIKVTAPNINGGSEKTLTDAGGDDEGDWNVTGTNTVTVSGISLSAGESATVKFRVEVQ
ncbi:MAG: hypothetical protein Kow0092_32860 [Deferrisomatales bacterium]